MTTILSLQQQKEAEVVINKALYDVLVGLGANATEAEEAARQDVKIEELRQMIYELTRQTQHLNNVVIDFKAETNARFEQVDRRFDKLDGRMDRRDKEVDARFDRLEKKLDQLLEK